MALKYGHLNFQGLMVLAQKKMVVGLPEVEKINHCEKCVFGKLARFLFQCGRSWRARQKLQSVYADVCGPMQSNSNRGGKYFLLFINDFSRMCWVYISNFKHEVFSCFQKFVLMVERQSRNQLKIIKID